MALMTANEYRQSLRDGRVVYSEGKRIEDVTKDPLLSSSVDNCAAEYALAQMPEWHDLLVETDPDTGEEFSFVFSPMKTGEDLLRRREIIQRLFRAGVCAGGHFAGVDCLHSMALNTALVDNATGSNYSKRAEEYRKFLMSSDSAITGAVTDAKGDRSLRPGQQVQHKDFYVHIVDECKHHGEDGIIVRGAKMFISYGAVCNEALVMPCRAVTEEDKDYAVVFSTPMNAEGITMISSDEEHGEIGDDFTFPISASGHSASGALIFEDVFVPMDRVYLKKEWQYSANFTYVFADFHRLSGDSYKPVTLEQMAGLAALVAEYNGVDKKSHIIDKLTWLMLCVNTVDALGQAACQSPARVPGTDLIYPNPIYSNAAKFHFANDWHEVTKVLQDIAGGLPAAAFGSKDYFNPETRSLIDKYFAGKAGVPTEHRLRAMHLVREMTSAFHDISTIHGEGSMAAQRLAIHAMGNWDQAKASAKRLAGIPGWEEHPAFENVPKDWDYIK